MGNQNQLDRCDYCGSALGHLYWCRAPENPNKPKIRFPIYDATRRQGLEDVVRDGRELMNEERWTYPAMIDAEVIGVLRDEPMTFDQLFTNQNRLEEAFRRLFKW